MRAGLHEVFQTFITDLHDADSPSTRDLINCDPAAADTLTRAAHSMVNDAPFGDQEETRTTLAELLKRAYRNMPRLQSGNTRGWRRIYTDTSVLLAYADIRDFLSSSEADIEDKALAAVARLDHAIVIAGAPGDGRLDLILDMIDSVQEACLDSPRTRRDFPFTAPTRTCPPLSSMHASPLLTATSLVPRLAAPPSLNAFISRFSQHPFVLPGYLLDWPALNEHPWASLEYLRAVGGPGRVVPVEVGSDYRSDDWSQSMMPWDKFLSNVHIDEQPSGSPPKPVLYLAQHSLFTQFPALREDILVPDYVYCDLAPPSNYPQYVPPTNEERMVLNAWLGPRGTASPAHTDPFYNFYAQVVGRKTIWLAPPEVSPFMYPYSANATTSQHSEERPRNPAANQESPSMSNTSRVDALATSPDVITESKALSPDFWQHAVPTAMSVTLEPGDLLFFPPGWWHAMCSEQTSFSVSMWF